MKRFIVSSATLVGLLLAFTFAFLLGTASNKGLENDVVVSAGKVDLVSLTATNYRRSYYGNNLYEHIHVYPALRTYRHYSFLNSKLISVRVGNNEIDDPEKLLNYKNEAEEFLLETQKRFSDVMPPQSPR